MYPLPPIRDPGLFLLTNDIQNGYRVGGFAPQKKFICFMYMLGELM